MSAPNPYRRLGFERIAAGDVAGALAPLRTAHLLDPDDGDLRRVLVQALYVVGEQARLAGQPEEARAHLAEAAALAPDDAAAWNSLGLCHLALGTAADAAACFRRALAEKALEAAIHSNLGNALVRLCDMDGAEDAYARALALAPGNPEFRFNRALHLLRRGRLAEGWTAFAARLERPGRMPPCPGPLWDGSDPAGRTIAVWSEQGLGDELMFGTCIPDLVARAGRVIWECHPKLALLLAGALPRVTVVARPADAETARTPEARFPWARATGPVDGWIGCAGLPAFFRATPDTFAGSGGYLFASPARRRQAAEWLAALPRPRIGLCWRSSMTGAKRDLTYARADELAAVVAGSGASPVLLQAHATADELAALGMPVAAMPGLDLFNDLDGLAGLIAELDLVISAATSVAELAGALGVPVWRFGPQSDWTLLGATDGRRPWFSSMRVFTRPDCETGWSAPFAAMAEALRDSSWLPR